MTTMPISVLESICKYINTEEDLEKLAKEAKKETEDSEQSSEQKKQIQKHSKMEKISDKDETKTEGLPANKQATSERLESSSFESKRRRVRKSN